MAKRNPQRLQNFAQRLAMSSNIVPSETLPERMDRSPLARQFAEEFIHPGQSLPAREWRPWSGQFRISKFETFF